ncbi:glycerophosphoryl diester phosphodiesterase membrane domain-containing protein [Erythrobacter sp.]|jgi:hypothetical protein|uniref:glycerophosphoryl diester phosphodiesterase membrane domain-containing protein n=1 Tax=Erythrobacter sp. TaxID=1042 RepID=UPI002EB45156|nr:glycerophosphoryl diester phosphodiesterase membrane domain-containing protein [Erythrobacter sp.]
MSFDMNACWSRGIELVRDNFQLLLLIAATFLLLPTVALYLLLPDMQTLMDPRTDPAALQALLAENSGQWTLVLLVSLGLQFAGFAAMVALMGKARPTVGQALATGLKSVPGLFLVLISVFVLYLIGAALILVPISLLTGAAGAPALGLIAVIPVLLLIVWLLARLSMTMPVMVLEGRSNPFAAMLRSYRLTRPRQWAILLFWGVLFAVFTVISVLFNGIIGLIAALFGSGLATLLIVGLANGITSLVAGMIICALAAAMFGQLAQPSAPSAVDPLA